MLEFVFQFIAEFLLQIVFEALAELGLESIKEPFRRPPNPWLAAPGYMLFGAAAGGLSLLLFHDHLIAGKGAQLLNLLVTPLMAGATMSAVGSLRARRGARQLRRDRFAYGYLFALGFALVRFFFAR